MRKTVSRRMRRSSPHTKTARRSNSEKVMRTTVGSNLFKTIKYWAVAFQPVIRGDLRYVSISPCQVKAV